MSVSEPMRTRVHAAVVVELEVHALTLAQHPEERALERAGGEHELGAVGVAHDDAFTASAGRTSGRRPASTASSYGSLRRIGDTPIRFLRSYGFWTLPALRQEVQTWMRFGEPLTTARTRCTLGFQRRLRAPVRVAQAHAELRLLAAHIADGRHRTFGPRSSDSHGSGNRWNGKGYQRAAVPSQPWGSCSHSRLLICAAWSPPTATRCATTRRS